MTRPNPFTWLLILALGFTLVEEGLADKKKKKKKKQSTETSEQAEEPAETAPRVVKDVDKRLLAYDTSGARALLASEQLDSNSYLKLADGRILEQEGQFGQATSRLAAAASALSWDPAPLVYLGEAHLRANNQGAANDAFSQAEKRARKLLDDDDGDAEALYFLGVAQQGQGKYGEALASLEKARKASSRDVMVVFQIGATQTFQKNWQAAIDTLTQTIDMNPGIAYAYYYRGVAAGQVGRKDLMFNDLDRFLVMAPNAPEAEQARRLLSGF